MSFSIQVGKVDYAAPSGRPTEQGDRAAGILPSAQLGVVGWLEFWLNTVNSNMKSLPAPWAFTIRDAVALMGSHTLNAPQGCATTHDTPLRNNAQPGFKNKGCRGPTRMFTWNNWYFKVGCFSSPAPAPLHHLAQLHKVYRSIFKSSSKGQTMLVKKYKCFGVTGLNCFYFWYLV
jgi:hypothetical protein